MKRLTKSICSHPHGAEGVSEQALTGSYCRGSFEATAIVERLAAIEDILGDEYDIEVLQRMVNAEKPPCSIGDTLWTNITMSGRYMQSKKRPYQVKVVFIGLNDSDDMGHGFINVLYEDRDLVMTFEFSAFGNTIFRTKEAAIEALEKADELHKS